MSLRPKTPPRETPRTRRATGLLEGLAGGQRQAPAAASPPGVVFLTIAVQRMPEGEMPKCLQGQGDMFKATFVDDTGTNVSAHGLVAGGRSVRDAVVSLVAMLGPKAWP
jgi:hypothetical protein